MYLVQPHDNKFILLRQASCFKFKEQQIKDKRKVWRVHLVKPFRQYFTLKFVNLTMINQAVTFSTIQCWLFLHLYRLLC